MTDRNSKFEKTAPQKEVSSQVIGSHPYCQCSCLCVAEGSDERGLQRRQLCSRGSINSYDMVTRYSVDMSMVFLCVITRPLSRFDDDLLPCLTALLLSWWWKTGKACDTQHKWCENNEGLCLHECTTICTYMYRHMYDCVQSSLRTQRGEDRHTTTHTKTCP